VNGHAATAPLTSVMNSRRLMPIPSLAEAHIQNDSTQKTYGISGATIPGSRSRWFPYLLRANRPQTTPNESFFRSFFAQHP
jgi:hypothetical protein